MIYNLISLKLQGKHMDGFVVYVQGVVGIWRHSNLRF